MVEQKISKHTRRNETTILIGRCGGSGSFTADNRLLPDGAMPNARRMKHPQLSPNPSDRMDHNQGVFANMHAARLHLFLIDVSARTPKNKRTQLRLYQAEICFR